MGDANDNNLFHPLLDLLNTDGWSWYADRAFAAHKYSPLEFVLMMKADLATVQNVYEIHPEALTPRVLDCVSIHGYSPGVLGFLAENLPHALFEVDDHGNLPIHRAIDRDLISLENDIMKLIEIYPQSIMKPNNGGWTPWQMALGHKCSRKLYNFIFQELLVQQTESFKLDQDAFDDDDYRLGFDLDCIVGMNPVLSQIKTLGIVNNSWKIEALMAFLRLILQNQNLTDLTLETRSVSTNEGPTFRGHYQDMEILDDSDFLVDGDLPPTTDRYLNELITRSGIESLSLVFDNEHALPRLGSLMRALVLHLPQLKKLSMSVYGQPAIIEWLKQLLESSRTLESLKIKTWHDISPVMDGLAENSVLKQLSFQMLLDASQLLQLQERLLKILQNNTALEEVKHHESLESNRTPNGWEKIEYYTRLNRYGRAVAHNPNTTITDVVPLLRQESLLQQRDLEQSNVLFGLLRESPGLWCAHGSGADRRKNLCRGKRKRRQLEK